MATPMLVEINLTSRFCLLKSNEGELVGTYPFVWLRDNCLCSKCYHPSSRNRVRLMADLDVDIIPDKAVVDDQMMNITWPDGHFSPFPVSWLKELQFSNKEEDPVSVPVRQLWSGKTMQNKIPKFKFADLLSDDKSLYDWLEALQVFGLALITGAPQNEGAILQIGKRVSFLKKTHWGETFKLVTEKDAIAKSISFTTRINGFHIDIPYYDSECIQMLHCIKQAPVGGANQFADAVKVAEDLKKTEPELFEILATAPIEYRDAWSDHHFKNTSTVIVLSPDGSVKGICLDNTTRAPHMPIPLEQVHTVYRAIKMLNTMLYDDMLEVKLAPGEIGCFDNNRVVHGRSAFTITEASSRHMEGGYLGWDQARSRMRFMREKMLNLKPL